MIYTLTLSPSIDYYVKVKNLKLGEINRTNNEFIKIGGKGINVSFILKELNIPSTQVICTAGFTGDEIKQQLNNHNLIKYYSCYFNANATCDAICSIPSSVG